MDFDIAYANADFIPNGAKYPAKWAEMARRFRQGYENLRLNIPYGEDPSMCLDLALPKDAPRGLAVFVHGGYWMAFGRRDWTHLATGAVDQGLAMAIPSYPLAPKARIGQITQAIAKAVDRAADLVDGPIYLCGHSAGGHLVARMNCLDVALQCRARIRHIMAVSPLGDLHPLRQTKMNEVLRLERDEAQKESPAFCAARAAIPTTVWVGADERPAFQWQAGILTQSWSEADLVTAPDRHHFDVIAPLADPNSDMTAAWRTA